MSKLIQTVNNTDDFKKRILTIGFYGVLSYAAYRFGLKPIMDKAKKNKTSSNLINDPNSSAATMLYNAINPSGIKWMRSFDSTNEKKIYDAARSIKDWGKVQINYRNLYSRDLLSDLQSELDGDEYQTFLNILKQSINSNSNSVTNSNKGLLLVTNKDVRLRSTPDSSQGTFSLNSNILTVAKSNTFLGFSTGKIIVDDNGVKYYEVMIGFSGNIPKGPLYDIYKEQNSKTLRFFVGSGAIDKYSDINNLVEAGINIYPGTNHLGLRN
jgi:hypothetical protein